MQCKYLPIPLVIFFLFTLLYGCKVIYIPGMQNVPAFRQKKELQLTLSPTSLQTAYSITDKLGFTLNGFYRSGTHYLYTGKAWDYRSNRYCVDLGFGGYFRDSDKFQFEIFSGIGYGYASLKYETEGPDPPWYEGAHSNYYKIFTQPDFCFLTKHVDLVFSLRLSHINFYNFQEYDESYVNKQKNFFTEPALTFTFNTKYVSPMLQVQYSKPYSEFKYDRYLYDVYNRQFIVSLALKFNLHEFFIPDQSLMK